MTRTKAFLVSSLIFAMPIAAQFGTSIVYDPTQDVNAGVQITKAIATLEQLTQVYKQISSSYKLQSYMTQFLGGTRARWRSAQNIWLGSAYPDSTGLNGPWVGAINNGTGAIGAYGSLVTPAAMAAATPAEIADQVSRQQAQIERMDGAVTGAGDVLGRYTSSSVDYQNRVQALSDRVHSVNPDDNTSAALANLTNGALLLHLEATNTNNEFLRRQLELQNEQVIISREQWANQISSDANFYANGSTAMAMPSLTAGLANLRVP